MTTERQIIESLIRLQYECYDKVDLLEKAGIEYDIFGEHQILFVALDVLGYPKGNSKEFGDNVTIFHNGSTNYDTTKRTDLINFFCPDYIDEKFYDLKNEQNRVELFTNWLYQDIERLTSERSIFFVNNPKTNQN